MLKGKPTSVVLSTGKDGFFKIWDTESLLCLGVLTVGATEATSLVYCPERGLAYIGTNKD
jgi:hypothetical protein